MVQAIKASLTYIPYMPIVVVKEICPIVSGVALVV
jgi:hypothetical protein